MGCCPYGACDECRLFSTPPSECQFWSPMKKTCIMSSRYDEDEAEGVYWLYRQRKERMPSESQTYEGFLEDLEKVKKLEDGWLDGEGERISEAASSLVLEMAAFFKSRPPHVFPTPEGGLSLEWDTDEELDAEVGPDLKGIMIWKDSASMKDWTREDSRRELEACWLEAVSAEAGNAE